MITPIELFALDDYSSSSDDSTVNSFDSSSSSDEEDNEFNSLDECLNKAFTLGDYIQSPANPNK